MRKAPRTYRVEYELDESGTWVAVIDRSQGVSCVTQGRSLASARKRIREALAAYLEDEKAAADAILVDDFRLPRGLKSAVTQALRAREKAQSAHDLAMRVSEEAARSLAKAGLSTRDAAEVIGLSHQRVNQLASKASKRRTG